MIYFWSDTHFGHKNIIRYCNRPFATVGEMNAALIARWNGTVEPNDTIWFLGDFAFLPAPATRSIFAALNGHKHLIVGNHDNSVTRHLGWETVATEAVVEEFCLSHYPDDLPPVRPNAPFLLHGHAHGRSVPAPWRLDVGVDVFDRPVSIERVREKFMGYTVAGVAVNRVLKSLAEK